MLSNASRGEDPDSTTKAIRIAWNSLIQRFRDVPGMSDHTMLISMKTIKTVSQMLFLMAAVQSNSLLKSTIRAANMRIVKKIRSIGLPDSGLALVYWNQTPMGLLAV
jgi:hypothetical protein